MRRFFLGMMLSCIVVLSLRGGANAAPVDVHEMLPSEAITARKAAIQARLESLEQTALPSAEQAATRETLTQLLQALTALEDTTTKRATYVTRSQELPQRLQALEAERRALEEQPPPRLPPVTPALQKEFEAQRDATQAALQEIGVQAEADERRLVTLTKTLETLATERAQLDKVLLTERTKTEDAQQALTVELWTVKRQGVEATEQALLAERELLRQRRSLHDAQRLVLRLRLERLQRDLDRIKPAVNTALQQEQSTLQKTSEHLAQQLERTADPVEALRLAVEQETVEIRAATAEYQQQRQQLGEAVQTQEQRNAQEQLQQERLTALIAKYADNSAVAQRFAHAFERLRRERVQQRHTPVTTLEKRLQVLTDTMFALEDRLYAFDDQAEHRLAEVIGPPTAQPAPPRNGQATLRQAFATQKAALREQQQELTALLQDVTKLLTLRRDHRRLLDDGYHFVLTKMFWLRNAEWLGTVRLHELWNSVVTTGQRLSLAFDAERTQIGRTVRETPALWGLLLLGVPALLWGAARLQRRVGALGTAVQTMPTSRQFPAHVIAGILLVLRAALWPLVLVILLLMRRVFILDTTAQTDLIPGLQQGLYLSALVLWLTLAGYALLRQHSGLPPIFDLSEALCRVLRRVVLVGGLLVLLLAVPQHMLLTAPGEGQVALESFVISRMLFLLLQLALLILLAITGRPRSLLMQAVLARSQERHGLLWRFWPMVYLALLSGLVTLITLEALGYDYAARYLWSRTLASLAVGSLMLGPVRVLVLQTCQRLLHVGADLLGGWQQRPAELREVAVQRAWGITRAVWNPLVTLLTVGLLLQMWGVSVVWITTAPLTLQIVQRVGIIALTIGVVAALIQASRTLTDYLLQPRQSPWGDNRQAGRKLRTLAPLVQAIIRVGAIFAAGLVALEQLGVDTGPVLAGVGIFGLAVGFASQSLIKDVINGLFILFEDSISVGDVVQIRGTGGLVEKVTLRTVTLRDLSGNVHIIPNSTIEMVTNMTREYSYYLFRIRVAYDSDIDAVWATLREVDSELRQDPDYAPDIIEPLEIMGLDSFEDVAMVVQARLKTRPIKQWYVGREFHRRMKRAFDQRGIVMPLPQMVLSGWVGTSPDGGRNGQQHGGHAAGPLPARPPGQDAALDPSASPPVTRATVLQENDHAVRH